MSGRPAQSVRLIEVVAGVIRDDRGRILLAQRPAGKHLAGTWEFPGGKREGDESDARTLARELAEELDIEVVSSRPWLSLTHHYPELAVRLKLYEVDEWRGQPSGLEGQSLDWVSVAQMNAMPMPAADRPIVRAFGIDDRYAISPEPRDSGDIEGILAWAREGLDRGLRLFQLRAGSVDAASLASMARAFGEAVAAAGGRWLLNGPPALAIEAAADGVHLDAPGLRSLDARPLGDEKLVMACCRNESDLARAGALGLDFVTLSPVLGTEGVEHAEPLGWAGFERLSRRSPLPVYARGGVGPGDLSGARERGGFGVAGTYAAGETWS
ncbi:Nudix family hydrolase [Wenzhouxiangella sp. EGI_FJ10409]|uniref:Nudix family hydrolase n=1 Tax=Wenzhouxiangella sp. EGI_FJ10409 TaxID=3243767 RepID=UPI0035D6C72C